MQKIITENNADVIIIGAGMAGLSSAIWCGSLGRTCIVFEENNHVGGQLDLIGFNIADYPGWAGNTRDLPVILKKQAEDHGASIRCNEQILTIDGETGIIKTHYETYKAKAIIIASGLRQKPLPIDAGNFKEIYHSVSLNREKFKDKRVLILGGGDGAFHAALSLNDHTRSLAIAYRSTRVKADQRFQEKLRSFKDIAVFPETELKSIQSRSGGFQAILKGPNGEITLKMDVILVKFGFEPRNDLVRGQCLLDQSGYIITDKDQKTSSKTIWAIGDVCNPYYPSLSTAAGHACIAVKNIASTVFS